MQFRFEALVYRGANYRIQSTHTSYVSVDNDERNEAIQNTDAAIVSETSQGNAENKQAT